MRAVVRAKAGWAGCRLVAMALPLLAALGSDASIAEEQLKGGPTPSPPGAEVYFTNLQDGATVATKFSVNFGLNRMGVAPAGSDRKDSGHHHLLIDTDLPPLDQPVPNDFNHLHFGAGQTEATVTLRPGDHTLQLLLADKDHIPHSPPVMSAQIKIHVVSETPPAPPPATARSLTRSPPGAEVYFVDFQDGATVQRRFRVRFGLRNMGIAPAGSDREDAGHHHLLIDTELPPLDQPVPNDFNHLDFGSGETETTLTLSPGEHTLQLLLGDGDHVPHGPPVMSARIRVRVVDNVAAPAPGADPGHVHPAPAPASASPPAPAPTLAPGTTSAPGPVPPVGPALAPGPARTPDPSQEAARGRTPPAGPDPSQAPSPSSQRPAPSPGGMQAYVRRPSPRGASVHFVGRRNGDKISPVVTLQFGVENMDIRPAGLPTRGSGHYHLSIDRKLPPFDKPMPVDSSHLDFRDGQTLAKISLTPGEHTLQLLLVDENNMAHDPPVMSAPLRVVVADLANSNRDDRSRRDSPPREASSPGLSQNGPSQYGAPPYGNGPNRYGSNGYGPNRYGPYRYGPHRYGPYRYGRPRFNHYRYGRGWRW